MSKVIFEGGLGYEGKVTLTLKSNNRVLKSKTYKNNGTTNLFSFLGHCLIGEYEEVKSLLPNKILLLYNEAETPEVANPQRVLKRSEWQELSMPPTISIDSIEQQVRVTYSFEVPKNHITGDFNQVALYGNGTKNDYIQDFSAYYYLTDSVGKFETQTISLWSATTVLLIEWELTLSNKNTEGNSRAEET